MCELIALLTTVVFLCLTGSCTKNKNQNNTHVEQPPVPQLSGQDDFHGLLTRLLTIPEEAMLKDVLAHMGIPQPVESDSYVQGFPASWNLEGSETWCDITDRYAVSILTAAYRKYKEAREYKVKEVSLFVRVSVKPNSLEDWRRITPRWEGGSIVEEPR
jgi:hypothetical protein